MRDIVAVIRSHGPHTSCQRSLACAHVSGLLAPGGASGVLKHNWAFCHCGVVCTPVLSLQLVQQHLGLLEVGGVKALGKPAVDGHQQLVGPPVANGQKLAVGITPSSRDLSSNGY